uniref:Uncharacterized protein n=1 Tax=Triticum urartu TaxID=4572 RepID=A0A8R7PSW9_TRIUA
MRDLFPLKFEPFDFRDVIYKDMGDIFSSLALLASGNYAQVVTSR